MLDHGQQLKKFVKDTMRIAFDIKLMRPGCVLVQAAMGADPQTCHPFDTEDWLLTPTPDMKVYPVTDEQLDKLVTMTEQNRNNS